MVPRKALGAALTTTAEHLVPSIEHLLTERIQSGQASWLPKVLIEALEGRVQVPLVDPNAVMPAGFQRLFHFLEEFSAAFRRRSPLELPPALPGAGSAVGHSEEVERHAGLVPRLGRDPCKGGPRAGAVFSRAPARGPMDACAWAVAPRNAAHPAAAQSRRGNLFSNRLTAACKRRSSTSGMPRGRCFCGCPGFGMCTRRVGGTRYGWAFSRSTSLVMRNHSGGRSFRTGQSCGCGHHLSQAHGQCDSLATIRRLVCRVSPPLELRVTAHTLAVRVDVAQDLPEAQAPTCRDVVRSRHPVRVSHASEDFTHRLQRLRRIAQTLLVEFCVRGLRRCVNPVLPGLFSRRFLATLHRFLTPDDLRGMSPGQVVEGRRSGSRRMAQALPTVTRQRPTSCRASASRLSRAARSSCAPKHGA